MYTQSSDNMSPQKSHLCRQPLCLPRPLRWIHTVWFSKLRQAGSLRTSKHWAHSVFRPAHRETALSTDVSMLVVLPRQVDFPPKLFWISVCLHFSSSCVHSLSLSFCLSLPLLIFALSVFAQTSTILCCMIALSNTWECFSMWVSERMCVFWGRPLSFCTLM